MATELIAVTDALLNLERSLVGSAQRTPVPLVVGSGRPAQWESPGWV